jgi:hypothetical protein
MRVFMDMEGQVVVPAMYDAASWVEGDYVRERSIILAKYIKDVGANGDSKYFGG